jgi:hypothetical protein
MTLLVSSRYRMALAWVVCIFCSLCGVSLAVLLWWALPPGVTTAAPNRLMRLLGETILFIAFLALAGVGVFVGVMLSRRFLSESEFAKLTVAPPDRDF